MADIGKPVRHREYEPVPETVPETTPATVPDKEEVPA